jgi:hypothetical protein
MSRNRLVYDGKPHTITRILTTDYDVTIIDHHYPKPRRSQIKRWRKLLARGIPAKKPTRRPDGRAEIRYAPDRPASAARQ